MKAKCMNINCFDDYHQEQLIFFLSLRKCLGEYSLNNWKAESAETKNKKITAIYPNIKAAPIWIQNLVNLLHIFIHCKLLIPSNAIADASIDAAFVANTVYTIACTQQFILVSQNQHLYLQGRGKLKLLYTLMVFSPFTVNCQSFLIWFLFLLFDKSR